MQRKTIFPESSSGGSLTMQMPARLFATAVGLGLAGSIFAAESSDYLTPQFRAPATYSNVFSISRSIKADGYDELVGRNGGSADYVVTASNPASWHFRLTYRYDGQPEGVQDLELRDGGRTACGDGKCARATDASGLIFNPALWGLPPKHLLVGGHWKVSLRDPWELGGSKGEEVITVIRLDSKSGTVTLMREGSSEGSFADESKQIKMKREGKPVELELIPGVSRWKGYTTFAKGVVISDELLVNRLDILKQQDGKEITAVERRIMLLNASPPPTLGTDANG
jgi:hypothetical protein